MSQIATRHVAVAVVLDEHGRVLIEWNDPWGAFTLPMTKMRVWPHGPEPADNGALRAAAAAVGVPVRLTDPPLGDDHREWLLSGRTGEATNYHFHLRRVDPHPRFVDRLVIRRPHFWASPYSLLDPDEYQPMSASVPVLIGRCVGALGVPQRTAPTTTLVLTRTGQAGTEFLLRWNPNWGKWTFPAAPRGGDDPYTPPERVRAVAGEDLGDTAKGLPWAVHPTEVVLDRVASENTDPAVRGVPTRYRHEVATAGWNDRDVFRSAQPLHWATADELRQYRTGGVPQVIGSPKGRAGAVSATAARLAAALDLLDDGGYDDEIRSVIGDWFG